MRVLGIIPARKGSKGLVGKNKYTLNGLPLIEYTLNASISSKLKLIVVSSDDPEILNIASKYNVTRVERPKKISGDTATTHSVLLHTLEVIGRDFDAVMTLQPTSPLRTATHIDDAIDLFCQDDSADSLVSVVQVPHNFTPQKLMSMENGYLNGSLKLKRRQLVDQYFARNGAAIYLTRMKSINEFIVGGRIIPFIMSKLSSIDIDDLEDIKLAEALLKYDGSSHGG